MPQFPLTFDQDTYRKRVFGVFAVGWVLVMVVGTCVGLGAFFYGLLIGEPSITIHHDGGPATLWVNGERVRRFRGPGVATLSVPRGDSTIEVRGARRRQWSFEGLTGLDARLMPTNPNTCFVSVEVSGVIDGGGDRCERVDEARITCLHRRFPEDPGSTPVFDIDALRPSSGALRFVMVAVPCGKLDDVTGPDLVSAQLGCR